MNIKTSILSYLSVMYDCSQRPFSVGNAFQTVPCLTRDEIDGSFIIATDPVLNLPAAAVENMLKHPLISVEPHETPTSAYADIVLPVKICGVECEGTAYRIDYVPIMLRKVKDAPVGLLSDREIIEILIKKVKRKKGL